MATLAFDTLKAAKALRDAGFAEAQAEAVVTTVGEAIDGNVATKADLIETRAALEAKITDLKADLYRLVLMAAVAIIGFTAGLTVALVKLIP